MQIKEIPLNLDLAGTFARNSQPERAAGLHVTDIIRWIENHTYHKGERKPSNELNASERERMAMYTSVGFAWEIIIKQALEKIWCHEHYYPNDRWVAPGEIEKDGLLGNPDWFDAHEEVLEEFKATYRSSRHNIATDFRGWIMQVKAYSYMLGVRRARIRAFFLNGDYRESGPQIKMWEFTFTPAELEENWRQLLINGRAMELEKKKNEQGQRRI